MSGTWRDEARPVIAGVIRDVGLGNTVELKNALHKAYPFGERAYYPYKIWLDEIKRQLGTKEEKISKKDKRQLDLWSGQGD